MLVVLTMAAVAVCALLFLKAGPVAALTIKSWMSIMSPAKVLSSFTSRKVLTKDPCGRLWKIHYFAGVKAVEEFEAVLSIFQAYNTVSLERSFK